MPCGSNSTKEEQKETRDLIKKAFGDTYEHRDEQISMIQKLNSSHKEMTVAEWPCAAGKSTTLNINAKYWHS